MVELGTMFTDQSTLRPTNDFRSFYGSLSKAMPSPCYTEHIFSMATTLSTIEELRAHLAQIAPVRVQPSPIATGHPPLDTHLGGWPHPGLASIYGAVGTGRIGLVLPALQKHTQAKRTVAIVDPLGWLHPPGLPGVNFQHLMLIRCGSPKAGWAASQLARCGAIPLVVLLDPPRLARDGLRLLRATESGHSTAIVLSEQSDPHLSASVRLRMLGHHRIQIERGVPGSPIIEIPPWTTPVSLAT